ncbi:cytochrome o ubiquinol oxidase subunit IV [Pseudooceanicola sp. CBS1P-1]|uniref:Cytochrome bo(3) ubiquinol oxidase subunit 4 n=1 Tax=Pseudooceanicola albus TaxID=2692189 RepID=A0A6L7G1R0_9RHOB|nr:MULTISPECIES: cytochrome o ubiquinol oxidase subunit IV [Pseudooceanicola]MBT9385001.1 cytochrome o ubiquinol oxidase subunit IV [Pseudooceanicola endophyticus]MXN18005.1 cytochrome o ubiquinol oxidase subunit IV [Pseudooceanicola albus]
MSTPTTHSHGTMGKLMMGFAMSIILTIIPFGIVMGDPAMSSNMKIGIIMGLGAIQIIVHLVYFLHLDTKGEGGWTMAATMLAIVILVIVMAGSLWVMHNMNENMMPMPNDMKALMDAQGGEAMPLDMDNMEHGGTEETGH